MTVCRRRWKGALLLFFAIAATLASGVVVPAGEPAAEERIRELEKRVAELEAALRRIQEMGGAESAAELRRRIDLLTEELEKTRMGEAAAPRAPESRYGLGPAASRVYRTDRGVSIGGYGEALLQDFDATRDDGARTGRDSVADMLRAVLYFGYKFNDRMVFNSEIEYEHATTGSGDEDKGEVSVEFANLDFLLHPAANIRAGLVLVPVGFINELHEPPIFLGARRPDVENRVIPATWREMGVGVFGDAGPFSYRAYAVNGFDAVGFTAGGLRGGRQSGSEASARDVAVTARLDFTGVPGLLLGASFYAGDSGQGAEDAVGEVIDGRVTLYDLHAEYAFRGLQIRGLWSVARLDDADRINRDLLALDPADPNMAPLGVGSRMTGWYGQAGYDVLSWMGERTRQTVIPFVRYERFDTQDRLPSGFTSTGANDVRVITYGTVWKPIPQLAIKVDLQDYDRADDSATDQINAAIGYLF